MFEIHPSLLKKEKEKEGLLPVRGLNILKADSRGRCIPCHAGVVVAESQVPCTLTNNHKRTKLISDF